MKRKDCEHCGHMRSFHRKRYAWGKYDSSCFAGTCECKQFIHPEVKEDKPNEIKKQAGAPC